MFDESDGSCRVGTFFIHTSDPFYISKEVRDVSILREVAENAFEPRFGRSEVQDGSVWSGHAYRRRIMESEDPYLECLMYCYFDFGECSQFVQAGQDCYLGDADGVYDVFNETFSATVKIIDSKRQ